MGDKQYYARRAAEEHAAAERATDERARKSHFDLAEAYREAAISGDEPAGERDQKSAAFARTRFRVI